MSKPIVGTALASLVVGVILGTFVAQRDADAVDPAKAQSNELVSAETRTLEVTESTTGELATAQTTEFNTIGSGTVTQAAAIGAEFGLGSTIARVDDSPVVMMYGQQPVWRTLEVGASDGADVAALEFDLVGLGFDPSSMVVDDHFDSDTADAVYAWEESLERAEPDGIVSMGEIIFSPSAVQVTESVPAGTRVSPGDALATVRPQSGSGLQLTFSVTEEAERYQPGQPVRIVAADGTTHDGEITAFERVASENGGQGDAQAASFTVAAVPANSDAELAAGPVTVEIPTEVATDVVAVPARALVAVVEGGQAVKLADGSLVGVTIGIFADGWVEVSGDGIADGTKIEVAA